MNAGPPDETPSPSISLGGPWFSGRRERFESPMSDGAPAERSATGSLAAAISNGVVRLMNEYTGRGPTRARTYISDDLVSVVLRDTLTKGERSLVADDKTELVLSTRKAFQITMRDEL